MAKRTVLSRLTCCKLEVAKSVGALRPAQDPVEQGLVLRDDERRA